MEKILFYFWVRRFVLIFAVAFAMLAAVEFGKGANLAEGMTSLLGWSAAAAAIGASIATYWAYRIQCKIVFKDDDNEVHKSG